MQQNSTIHLLTYTTKFYVSFLIYLGCFIQQCEQKYCSVYFCSNIFISKYFFVETCRVVDSAQQNGPTLVLMANRIHPTQCYTLAWILRDSFGPTPYWKVALCMPVKLGNLSWCWSNVNLVVCSLEGKTDSKREGGKQWSTSMGCPVLSLSKPRLLFHLSMRIHRRCKSTTSLRRCSGGAGSPDVVEREYADLNLKPMYGVSNVSV